MLSSGPGDSAAGISYRSGETLLHCQLPVRCLLFDLYRLAHDVAAGDDESDSEDQAGGGDQFVLGHVVLEYLVGTVLAEIAQLLVLG